MMIRVLYDGKEKEFDTESEAHEFYLTAKVERYITVFDEDGKPAYGAIQDKGDDDD